jgi:hypothetical protein
MNTGTASIPSGTPVYDAGGENLGTVSDRQEKDGFLVVHKGHLFGRDALIPHAAIDWSDMNGVHLRVRKGELKGMNLTPMPEPTGPIRHISGAPAAVAADQPSTIPLAQPLPMPDMDAAAVAATAFSADPAREPAPASGPPVQSAVGAAQGAAGQATDFVREQTAPAIDSIREQVGPLVDSMRERVGPMVSPIAEQVKDQASAVAQQQMTSAAEGLDSAAGVVNAVGDRLRENDLGALSQYTDLAAEQIEKAAAWLRTTTPEEIARNVEDFAKKQPELFAAAAVALGLIGLRFLRSTGQNTDEKKND